MHESLNTVHGTVLRLNHTGRHIQLILVHVLLCVGTDEDTFHGTSLCPAGSRHKGKGCKQTIPILTSRTHTNTSCSPQNSPNTNHFITHCFSHTARLSLRIGSSFLTNVHQRTLASQLLPGTVRSASFKAFAYHGFRCLPYRSRSLDA